MIKAGIVGIGRWGQTLVRAVANKSDRIRFVRGVTRTPAKVTAFGAEIGIPIDDSYEDLLADPDIDAVVLATPHSQHLGQIIQAADAGKHVFVEKPLALDALSAARACHAAEAAGIVLALGHNRRCLPAYRRLREVIADGALGDVLHVEGNFSGPSAYRQSRKGWRADGTESPAGGMTGKGIHITDLMISLLGPVREVTAFSSRQVLPYGMDDTTVLMMRFAGRQSASLSTLTATPDDWRLQVYGSQGWAEIRDERHLRIRGLEGDVSVAEFEPVDIERAILEQFAATIRDRTPWFISAEEAIANSALLEAIVTSVKQQARVTIELPDERAGQPGR
jgi:predicted dehydrogenase